MPKGIRRSAGKYQTIRRLKQLKPLPARTQPTFKRISRGDTFQAIRREIKAAMKDIAQNDAAIADLERLEIMGKYAVRISIAIRNTPRDQLGGVLRSIKEARTAELAAITRRAAEKAAADRKATMQRIRGDQPAGLVPADNMHGLSRHGD